MNRYFKGLFKIVNNQYYLYPIGFLFGLGFDTAS
jgi:high-affinity nickel-transport protein